MAELRKQAELGRKYVKELRREVARLAMLADDGLDGTVLSGMIRRLEEPELLELRRAYEARVAKRFPPEPQLRHGSAVCGEDEAGFLI